MSMKHIAVVAALAASALVFDAAGAVEWRNLTPERQLVGRKTSEGYLKGKVLDLKPVIFAVVFPYPVTVSTFLFAANVLLVLY